MTRHTLREALAPLALLATIALGAAAVTVVWLALAVAGLIDNGAWSPPPWSPRLLTETPPTTDSFALVLACSVGLLSAVVIAAILLLRRLIQRLRPAPMLDRAGLGDLAGDEQEKRARSLRGMPKRRELSAADRGIRLGLLDGREIWMSWEDVALVIMGPRSNKTSAVAVPAVLSAPGLAIATSNKSDLWALTSGPRREVGPVWTFDPQQIAFAPQAWWWDPLRAVRDAPADHRYEAAARLAGHFMATIGGQRRDPFFHAAGEQVLVGTLLAAALSDATMREVSLWLQQGRRDALVALDRIGATGEAAELEAALNGADVTAKGIFQTARTATKSLASERTLRWITPPHTWRAGDGGLQEELDPWQLVLESAERPVTAHLMSKEGAGTAAPVVAALVDRILDVAESHAQASGGRLDPPVVAVLDEAANICPIQELPKLYSHYGSRGIQVLTMLQSYQQGVGVWGAQGMDALWSAATVKLVGAGVDDHAFLQRLSGLIGDHDVDKQSVSVSRGSRTWQTSTTRQPIMPPDALRALDRTRAVLLTSGRRTGVARLLPWYREDHAADIRTYADTALAELRASAREALGPRYDTGESR
ncbi:type IV secretory system conjugative DNA transfer family protein [Pseudonocardia xishanensis]|uniref:TraD/TraG TraM recognition site domain-containing protein n=1 Tax=Pseudonocardia xishanensis TaxID=630995 RepID=A0ABP8S627_9PSEU